MAVHFSILAWRISWTEEPAGLQSQGYKELNMTSFVSSVILALAIGSSLRLSPVFFIFIFKIYLFLN